MNQELADITALQAIAYILQSDKRREWLMNETGLSPDDFTSGLNAPEVKAGVLDFLLAHEAMLLEFCEENKVDPTVPIKARRLFPGAVLEY